MQYENDELKRLVGLSRHVRSDEAIKQLADDMRRAADRIRARGLSAAGISAAPLQVQKALADELEPTEADR